MKPQEFAEAVAGPNAEERLLREQLSRDPSAAVFEAHKTFAVDPHFDLFAKEDAGFREHPAATAAVNGVEAVMDHAELEIAVPLGESRLDCVLEQGEDLDAKFLSQAYGEMTPTYGLDPWPSAISPQGASAELLAIRAS